MVQDDHDQSKATVLSNRDITIAAAASGFMTRLMCQPLDVLKIRFQLQSSGQKYTSLAQAFKTIVREEGVTALWKGHVPAQALSITYGVLQFTTWEQMKKLGEAYDSKIFKSAVSFGGGAVAGSTGTLLTFPFDVIRTRLVAQSVDARTYNNLLHAVTHIYTNEGILAFYKGLFPTIIQVVPYSGAQFMFYTIFTKIYSHYVITDTSNNLSIRDRFNVTFGSAILCGSLAGFCAKTVVYPLDLAKKRIQIQGMKNWIFSKQNFHCKGLLNCIYLTAKFEGFLGLYKGIQAALLKAIFTSGVQFASYDVACLLIKIARGI